MNLHDTLQRVLAESKEFIFFPKSFRCNTCGLNFPAYCLCKRPWVDHKDRAKIFISQALTESLKEAFAFIKMKKADHVKRGENKEHVEAELYGCVECYEDDVTNAALQAIEEKKKNYMGQ